MEIYVFWEFFPVILHSLCFNILLVLMLGYSFSIAAHWKCVQMHFSRCIEGSGYFLAAHVLLPRDATHLAMWRWRAYSWPGSLSAMWMAFSTLWLRVNHLLQWVHILHRRKEERKLSTKCERHPSRQNPLARRFQRKLAQGIGGYSIVSKHVFHSMSVHSPCSAS